MGSTSTVMFEITHDHTRKITTFFRKNHIKTMAGILTMYYVEEGICYASAVAGGASLVACITLAELHALSAAT